MYRDIYWTWITIPPYMHMVQSDGDEVWEMGDEGGGSGGGGGAVDITAIYTTLLVDHPDC